MPLVDQVKPAAQSLGVGMYASLMGTFDLLASINYIGSISMGRSIVIVVDEGASTCVMSLLCWKALGSPELVPSNTLLTALDGRSFHLHGILPAFEIKLAGKVVSVEVEVIDAPLDYNFLLGRS